MSSEMRCLSAEVEKLVCLRMVCLAASTKAERSFCALRHLKTWLISTTTQGRLNYTAICHVHQQGLDELDIVPLMREFLTEEEQTLVKISFDASVLQCELDSIPTWLLKESATDLAPFLMDMFNKSLCFGEVSMALKKSIVTPILTKPKFDADDLAHYRSVSNLPFICKLLKKIVAKRLSAYLDDNKLLSRHQSAYQRFHYTETALLRGLSDLTSALASGKLALLSLLDMRYCGP